MKPDFTVKFLRIMVAALILAGCGGGARRDPILKLNPYQNLAFYGKVVDKATRENPLYPITVALLPEDPGNHIVVDSCIFFIEDKGLDPVFDYSLKVWAQYYEVKEIPLKYSRGKALNLGLIELQNIEPRIHGPFKIKPFVEFNPGSGILEKPGWSMSSFLSYWESIDQPFNIEDVEKYVKDNLPAESPEISKAEITQAVESWLKDGLIQAYGRNSYILK